MGKSPMVSFASAVHDFRSAQRQGVIQDIVARLRGRPSTLLAYEDVRRRLGLHGSFARGLRDIPLDAIVGSVARYNDFTRSFLPKNPSDENRWAKVMVATSDMKGLPPIEVYQVGKVYFVLDGNHRVSVARRVGAPTISAQVYEVPTPVSLSPDDRLDDLIVKAEYADFLSITRLDRIRPGAELAVTVPGQYRVLLEQIAHVHAERSKERGPEYSYSEAVGDWYDEEYAPAVRVIHEHYILADFPGRTEADLFVWTVKHRATLEASLGWTIRPAAAADDFARRQSAAPRRVAQRLGSIVRSAIVPPVLDSGPPPGFWRREQRIAHQAEHLISDLLVPIGGSDTGWQALEFALVIARHEEARVHGLYVIRTPQTDPATVQTLRDEWRRRCTSSGVQAELAIDYGNIADRIVERARWADAVVIGLAHAPSSAPLERLGSGFSEIIRRCPRSILAVPGVPAVKRALLAYDGSAKAEEALFGATYIALRWKLDLVVVTVVGSDVPRETLDRARTYLEQHGVHATYVEANGPAGDTIVNTAGAYHCDVVVVGGYGTSPLVEAVFGSTVDHILRASGRPTLICR